MFKAVFSDYVYLKGESYPILCSSSANLEFVSYTTLSNSSPKIYLLCVISCLFFLSIKSLDMPFLAVSKILALF